MEYFIEFEVASPQIRQSAAVRLTEINTSETLLGFAAMTMIFIIIQFRLM